MKHFPAEGFDSQDIDLLHEMRVYYTGLYERQIEMEDGTSRSYKAYIPETASYGDESVYIAVPDDVNTAEFLTRSGWIELAEQEKNAVILCVFEPRNQKWGDEEQEVEYIRKVYMDMTFEENGLHSFIFPGVFNWRWIGYGSGAEMILRYAFENPMDFASLVAVDGCSKIREETLNKAGETCFVNSSGHRYSEWPNKKIPVPVWLIGAENEAVVKYWRTANDCTLERTELPFGYRYDQDPLSPNLMTFDQKVGQVRVTTVVPDYTDDSFTGRAFRFLHAFSRSGKNSPYANMLYPTAEDSRFRRETVIVDDMEREWYVYLPSSYTGKEPMPLVIYFHGRGQTGLVAMRQGGWWNCGERKNFITVCPTGSLSGREKGQIPFVVWKTGMPIWSDRTWQKDDHCETENRFIRQMLGELTREYNIDKSRMYICGQSNGGRMTQMMAEKGADLFAAAASTGAPSVVAQTSLPLFICGGEYDLVPANLTEDDQIADERIADALRKRLQARGIDYEKRGLFRSGIFTNMVWSDEQGIPVCRFCSVRHQAHSWRQNMASTIWDEWFCRFTRNPETDRIEYMHRG